MSADVISLVAHTPALETGVLTRLRAVLAILRAIDAGELLSAVPECELARAQHTTALALLGLAERELLAISLEVAERRGMALCTSDPK